MLTFGEMQDEVKRRALRNQSGTEFDITVKNIINASLFRVSRESAWRVMRRMTHFDTVTSYTSGTGAVTVTISSTAVSVTGCKLFTDKIEIGRKVEFGTDSGFYTIRSIASDTEFSIDRAYEGTTSTATSYEILPQEQYTIPMQAGHRMFMWHEDFGYPYMLTYVPDQSFWGTGAYRTTKDSPTCYRMWGEDMVITALPSSTYLSVESSSATDTLTSITIFGNIGGYPGSGSIVTSSTNATTSVTGTNLFDTAERFAVSSQTNGRITIKSVLGDYTIAVIPQGNSTGVIRKKVQLYPLPSRVFPINVYYYKDPFPLVNSGDVHEMGGEFDEAIILLSVAKLKYQDDQAEGDRFTNLYADEIRSLRRVNVDKIDWFPTLQRPWGRNDFIAYPNLSYRQIGGYYGPRV